MNLIFNQTHMANVPELVAKNIQRHFVIWYAAIKLDKSNAWWLRSLTHKLPHLLPERLNRSLRHQCFCDDRWHKWQKHYIWILACWERRSSIKWISDLSVKNAIRTQRQLVAMSLVAYGSGKRMGTGTRAGSRIKTENFKRQLLPHHMSQRRDIWCTNSPVISCFNYKFVDRSVPYKAKQRRLKFRRSFGNIPSEFR